LPPTLAFDIVAIPAVSGVAAAVSRATNLFLDDNDATLGTVNRSEARRRLNELDQRMSANAVAPIGGRGVSEAETAKHPGAGGAAAAITAPSNQTSTLSMGGA
jgi:predicted ABC-class ATPase